MEIMTVDERTAELAEYFLQDTPLRGDPEALDDLARIIQTAIEEWLEIQTAIEEWLDEHNE